MTTKTIFIKLYFPHINIIANREAIHVRGTFQAFFTFLKRKDLRLTNSNTSAISPPSGLSYHQSIRKFLPNISYLALQKGYIGNIWQTMHCRAFIPISIKFHVDMHLWIERTPLPENHTL